jgi:hypothetical protein
MSRPQTADELRELLEEQVGWLAASPNGTTLAMTLLNRARRS